MIIISKIPKYLLVGYSSLVGYSFGHKIFTESLSHKVVEDSFVNTSSSKLHSFLGNKTINLNAPIIGNMNEYGSIFLAGLFGNMAGKMYDF